MCDSELAVVAGTEPTNPPASHDSLFATWSGHVNTNTDSETRLGRPSGIHGHSHCGSTSQSDAAAHCVGHEKTSSAKIKSIPPSLIHPGLKAQQPPKLLVLRADKQADLYNDARDSPLRK